MPFHPPKRTAPSRISRRSAVSVTIHMVGVIGHSF
jgi:hypothetical protein